MATRGESTTGGWKGLAIGTVAAPAVGGRHKGEMASTHKAGVERPLQSVPEFGGCGPSATNDPVTT